MKIIEGKDKIKEIVPKILSDESKFTLGTPLAVYFPETIEDCVSILKQAQVSKTPITFSGGQTGITGGAVPIDNSIIISFNAMNQIIEIQTNSQGLTILYCHPGISLTAIDQFLRSPESWPKAIPGIELLKNKNLFYPPDPTEMSAQLGGTIANNASGARSYYYGPTRNHIHHITLLLANGDIVELNRGQVYERSGMFTFTGKSGTLYNIQAPTFTSLQIKNASGFYAHPGMDLIDLFIGSEGTLGCIVKVGIILSPLPTFVSGASFFPNRKSTFRFADFLRSQKNVAAIEFFDETALNFLLEKKSTLPLELPEFPSKMNTAIYWEVIDNDKTFFETNVDEWETQLSINGSSFDFTWSGIETHEQKLLKNLRHAVPETINATIAQSKQTYSKIRKIGTDASLPADVFEQLFTEFISMIQEKNIVCAAFGHLGDYHIHINLLPKNETDLDTSLELYTQIMHTVIENHGSVSAEHGIGKIKKPYLKAMYGEKILDEMTRIKSELDPMWLFNRGNLFDPPRSV